MALKAPRQIVENDITQTCDTVVNRGVVLVYGTAGSGVGLGDSAGVATVAANPSGKAPAGLLLNDVVSYDTTKFHGNFHQDQTLQFERCNLLRKGRVTTNNIYPGLTLHAGDVAYAGLSGTLTNAFVNTAATPKCGSFVGLQDENGYATVDINLPA